MVGELVRGVSGVVREQAEALLSRHDFNPRISQHPTSPLQPIPRHPQSLSQQHALLSDRRARIAMQLAETGAAEAESRARAREEALLAQETEVRVGVVIVIDNE